MSVQPRGTLQVLVVDDDPDICEALVEILLQIGYDADRACNGQEAVGYLDSHEKAPDVVILNLQMPVMDGWETLERIREHRRAQDTSVIVCSAHRHAKVPDADGMLTKPFTLEELLHSIEEAY